MKTVVLDSFALLGWLNKERSEASVEALLEQAELNKILLLLSAINAGEVYYVLRKRYSPAEAARWNEQLLPSLPVRVDLPDFNSVWRSAELKALYSISYADSFAASLALHHASPLVTGDPEFRSITGLNLHWIGN